MQKNRLFLLVFRVSSGLSPLLKKSGQFHSGATGGFRHLVSRHQVCYIVTMVTMKKIDRTQTGVRIAAPLLKVLKGLAEYKDMSLGDLLEGIVLHAFENKAPFSEETLKAIEKLRDIYDCDLTVRTATFYLKRRTPDNAKNP